MASLFSTQILALLSYGEISAEEDKKSSKKKGYYFFVKILVYVCIHGFSLIDEKPFHGKATVDPLLLVSPKNTQPPALGNG